MDDDAMQQAQHQDRLLIEQQVYEAIQHAERLGLSDDEAQLLRWACGVTA